MKGARERPVAGWRKQQSGRRRWAAAAAAAAGGGGGIADGISRGWPWAAKLRPWSITVASGVARRPKELTLLKAPVCQARPMQQLQVGTPASRLRPAKSMRPPPARRGWGIGQPGAGTSEGGEVGLRGSVSRRPAPQSGLGRCMLGCPVRGPLLFHDAFPRRSPPLPARRPSRAKVGGRSGSHPATRSVSFFWPSIIVPSPSEHLHSCPRNSSIGPLHLRRECMAPA